MEVIKKDGRVQPLEKSKIKVSILNAAADTEVILNEADINLIVDDVVKNIEHLRSQYGNTSSFEINGSVIDILKREGFSEIINKYIGFN